MKTNFKTNCPLCEKLISGCFDAYVGETGMVMTCPHCQNDVEIPDMTPEVEELSLEIDKKLEKVKGY